MRKKQVQVNKNRSNTAGEKECHQGDRNRKKSMTENQRNGETERERWKQSGILLAWEKPHKGKATYFPNSLKCSPIFLAALMLGS